MAYGLESLLGQCLDLLVRELAGLVHLEIPTIDTHFQHLVGLVSHLKRPKLLGEFESRSGESGSLGLGS